MKKHLYILFIIVSPLLYGQSTKILPVDIVKPHAKTETTFKDDVVVDSSLTVTEDGSNAVTITQTDAGNGFLLTESGNGSGVYVTENDAGNGLVVDERGDGSAVWVESQGAGNGLAAGIDFSTGFSVNAAGFFFIKGSDGYGVRIESQAPLNTQPLLVLEDAGDTALLSIQGGNYFGGLLNTGTEYQIDDYRLIHTPSTSATSLFFGRNSGNLTMTGLGNLGIGDSTGVANTIGVKNTYVGHLVGRSNLSGGANAIVGYGACETSSIAGGNAILGAEAAPGLNGSNSVYVGYQSGYNAAVSNNNVGVGTKTLYTLTSLGDNNTALGFQAGYSNATGDGNVFLGYQAGYSETGNNKLYIDNSNTASPLIYGDFTTNEVVFNNTIDVTGRMIQFGAQNFMYIPSGALTSMVIGRGAGNTSMTEGDNVFIGYQSASGYYEGTDNTYIGVATGSDVEEGDRNIFIGANAGENFDYPCDDAIIIGHYTSGNSDDLKIGTDNSTPAIRGEMTPNQQVAGFGATQYLAWGGWVNSDATPIMYQRNYMKYGGTSAVTLTDLDGPAQFAYYYLGGNDDTGPVTIENSGNFRLRTQAILGSDDFILVIPQADNDYVEMSRSCRNVQNPYAIKGADYTATYFDFTIEMTNATDTLTLPAGKGNTEFVIINSSAGNITVDADGAETIGNTSPTATITIATSNTAHIVWNGSVWRRRY